jgi:hypothetical protein
VRWLCPALVKRAVPALKGVRASRPALAFPARTHHMLSDLRAHDAPPLDRPGPPAAHPGLHRQPLWGILAPRQHVGGSRDCDWDDWGQVAGAAPFARVGSDPVSLTPHHLHVDAKKRASTLR